MKKYDILLIIYLLAVSGGFAQSNNAPNITSEVMVSKTHASLTFTKQQ